MHPRIQARRDSLHLARKQIIIRAIGDLCASMDYASGEIKRVSGFHPPELTEMAGAYRQVMARLQAEQVGPEELATISERINVSAQVALVFIRRVAESYVHNAQSSAAGR